MSPNHVTMCNQLTADEVNEKEPDLSSQVIWGIQVFPNNTEIAELLFNIYYVTL